jgi:hypothetical protein
MVAGIHNASAYAHQSPGPDLRGTRRRCDAINTLVSVHAYNGRHSGGEGSLDDLD